MAQPDQMNLVMSVVVVLLTIIFATIAGTWAGTIAIHKVDTRVSSLESKIGGMEKDKEHKGSASQGDLEDLAHSLIQQIEDLEDRIARKDGQAAADLKNLRRGIVLFIHHHPKVVQAEMSPGGLTDRQATELGELKASMSKQIEKVRCLVINDQPDLLTDYCTRADTFLSDSVTPTVPDSR